jgi:EpsI family protein
MEPEAFEMLKPDDYLNRVYRAQLGQPDLGLFIAYYKSQHRAAGAHDPKVCLPGSGWNPVSSKVIQIPTAQGAISANQFVVSKGNLTDVVVYWFQMQRRAVAGTEGLHFRRILETFSENRTDMALVRIVAPVQNNDASGATNSACEFVRAAYPDLMRQFPPRPPSR